MKTAIEAQDYSLIPADLQDKITAERFDQMIERKANKEAKMAELETIVVANDFSAFKTFRANMVADKQAYKLERMNEKLAEATTEAQKTRIQDRMSSFQERSANRTEKTDAELQEKFDEMVNYYNENGSLEGMKGERRGKRKGKRANFQSKRGVTL